MYTIRYGYDGSEQRATLAEARDFADRLADAYNSPTLELGDSPNWPTVYDDSEQAVYTAARPEPG